MSNGLADNAVALGAAGRQAGHRSSMPKINRVERFLRFYVPPSFWMAGSIAIPTSRSLVSNILEEVG